MVSRWGGDEFVVLGPADEAPISQSPAATRIREAVGRPCLIEGHPLRVTPSIGAVRCPLHGADMETLLRRADTAMYAAKGAGHDRVVEFEAVLEAGAQRRSLLQTLMRIDAERGAFTYAIQPKVNTARQAVGAELLLRWAPDAVGPVSPAEFVPIAEQLGVIDLLGRFAMASAAEAAVRLGGRFPVAVNLSPLQLLRPDLESQLLAICERQGCDPAWLELELTESALITDMETVRGRLERLRQYGFWLSLDDFGTGYSALSHLRALPFHKVKIDHTFVRNLDTDTRGAVVLTGIVGLCRSLGLQTVAEGIETETQFTLLQGMGVDEFQGYLFARPLTPAAWEAQVDDNPLGDLHIGAPIHDLTAGGIV